MDYEIKSFNLFGKIRNEKKKIESDSRIINRSEKLHFTNNKIRTISTQKDSESK